MVATNQQMAQAATAENRPLPLISEEYVPKALPKILGTWDMTATFFVSIFLVTTATTAVLGGLAAITDLLIACLVFFVPCIVATVQLGLMFPHEGSLYNWTHHAIGGRASFFAGFCAWFPGILISTSLAVLLVTYIQSMNSNWLTQTWQQGLVICCMLILTGSLSIQRFRTVQNVINVLVSLTVFACFLIGLSCIVWLATGHASVTNFSHWSEYGVNPDNFVLFGFMIFAYIGTEGPLNLAGEIKKLNKNRVPANAIIFQTTMGVVYTLVAFVVAPYFGIGDPAVFPIQIYNVSQAAAVLVWAVSASFLFFDLIGCYRKNRNAFKPWQFLPMPLLWVCIVAGLSSCIVAIYSTLRYSWIAQISNNWWGLWVGGLTLLFLIVALVGSMFANSEAAWQSMKE